MKQLNTWCAIIPAFFLAAESVIAAPPDTQRALPQPLVISVALDRDIGIYAPGEELSMLVTTSDDAYVTVFDIGSSGTTHIVFPNTYQSDNFVKGGKSVQIPAAKAPFAYRVGGPEGWEQIRVIASPSPSLLIPVEETQPRGPFRAVTSTASDAELAARVEQALKGAEHNGWNESGTMFEIVSATTTEETPEEPAAFTPIPVHPPSLPDPSDGTQTPSASPYAAAADDDTIIIDESKIGDQDGG